MHIRHIVFTRQGEATIQDARLEPPTDAGQLLVRAEHSVISPGTELAFLHGLPNTPRMYPVHPGYTGVGVVEHAGATAGKDFKPGDRVAGSLAHASHAVLNASECVHLPASAEPRRFAAWHLVSIALQGVRKGRVELGETVLVLGLGIIGNLAAQLARAAGTTFVAGVDPVDWRRQACLAADACAADIDRAKQSGPQRVRDGGFDLVIEATGVANAVNTAFAAVRRLGRVVLLGSTRGVTESVDFYNDVHKKGLTIIGAHSHLRADSQALFTAASDQRTAVELIASGRVDADALVTEWATPDQAPRAYARLIAREARLMTIGFDWTK
ncbi:MAG: zinc-binding dehydrogenase [Tepidisphaeraceae bacterium]